LLFGSLLVAATIQALAGIRQASLMREIRNPRLVPQFTVFST
jgi:hypothetical protein